MSPAPKPASCLLKSDMVSDWGLCTCCSFHLEHFQRLHCQSQLLQNLGQMLPAQGGKPSLTYLELPSFPLSSQSPFQTLFFSLGCITIRCVLCFISFLVCFSPTIMSPPLVFHPNSHRLDSGSLKPSSCHLSLFPGPQQSALPPSASMGPNNHHDPPSPAPPLMGDRNLTLEQAGVLSCSAFRPGKA